MSQLMLQLTQTGGSPVGPPPPVNAAPVWDATPAPQFIDGVASSYNMNVICTDPNLDALTFSMNTGAASLPSGVTFTDATGVLAYDGIGAAAATTGHVCTANDGQDTTDSASFGISIVAAIIHAHPRLAAVRYGLRNYALSDAAGAAERAEIARRDIAFLGMYKDGPWDKAWRTDYLMRDEVVTDLKARNPNLIIADYVNIMESSETSDSGVKCLAETGPTGNGGTWTPNDWFGRNTSGDHLSVASFITNPTAYVTLDASGRDYVDWRYETDFGSVILGDHVGESGVGPDGINLFLDNMFRRARHNSVDFNRDGTADGGRTDPFVEEQAAWRAGTAKVFTLAVADYPAHLNFGNISEWFAEVISPPVTLPDEYVGLLHGGEVQNNITNNPFCGIYNDGTIAPSFGSGELAQACYTYAMDSCIAPKYVANSFSFYVQGDPYDPGSASDFQHYRWAHTMSCLDDGYFMYEENTNYNNLVNMDEMGLIHTATTGLSGPNWLGDSIDPP
jgi:hypothetical protein